MARRDANKAVTAKMYRHFAVVTLVATVALAVATSDSNADQLNAEIASREAELKAAGKEVGKKAQPKLVRRVGDVKKAPPAATGWGSDEGGPSGGGGSGGGGESSYIPTGVGGRGMTVGMLRQVNLTPQQFYALSAEEQAALLKKIKSSGQVSPQEQEQRQQAMAAASLQRSGFEGPCNDC